MTSKQAYVRKLKGPRWQKKRLEILNRDNFTCRLCNDTESTLHVHHKRYSAGEPWDIPNSALVTLCESCHEAESIALSEVIKDLSTIIRDRFYSEEIHVLCGMFLDYEPESYGSYCLSDDPKLWPLKNEH